MLALRPVQELLVPFLIHRMDEDLVQRETAGIAVLAELRVLKPDVDVLDRDLQVVNDLSHKLLEVPSVFLLLLRRRGLEVFNKLLETGVCVILDLFGLGLEAIEVLLVPLHLTRRGYDEEDVLEEDFDWRAR